MFVVGEIPIPLRASESSLSDTQLFLTLLYSTLLTMQYKNLLKLRIPVKGGYVAVYEARAEERQDKAMVLCQWSYGRMMTDSMY